MVKPTSNPIAVAETSETYLAEKISASHVATYVSMILPIAILVIAFSSRIIPGPRTIDDAYITFRYARNILAGNGFVYNPGEHVLGTTTPLYTFLLTGIGAISGGSLAPFPQIAMILNALADAGTCLLLLYLGWRLGSAFAGAGAALVWAIAPFSVTFAIGGLETSLYVFLLTALVYVYLNKHFSLAALLAALTILTRPDALILVGPLAVDRLIQVWRSSRTPALETLSAGPNNKELIPHPNNGQALLREVLLFSLPLLAWFIFSVLYFGTPIPHSVAAKSMAYRLPPNAGLIRLLQHYANPFLGHLTFGNYWTGVGLILYPFLYIAGARKAFKAKYHSWPYLLYPWLYFAAFAIANPLIFRWYLTPPLPAYFLIILIGADRLIADTFSSEKRNQNPNGIYRIISKAVPVLVVIMIPLAMSLRDWQPHPDHGLDRPAPEMAWYKLELLYREAAKIVTPYTNQDSVLAAGDVGVLGYYTGVKILDTVGLNSAQTLDYYPLDPSYYVINYAIPPDLIIDNQPDMVVILEVYGRAGLLKDPRFLEDYRQIAKLRTDIYGSDGMLIFQRAKIP
jgi:arabinofuranosyltransferase